jgi:hypothetical protein
MPDYTHGIWRVALPLNQGDSALAGPLVAQFHMLRGQAIAADAVDLGHVLTALDIWQSVTLIESDFGSWAGDLGTHVLANATRSSNTAVGDEASLAGLADLQGDMDGDVIALHLPTGRPLDALAAYYTGDETLLNGVTWRRRYHTFAADLGLLDTDGKLAVDAAWAREGLAARARTFIELDEVVAGARHPLRGLRALFERDEQAQIEAALDTAVGQFLDLLAAGLAREAAA